MTTYDRLKGLGENVRDKVFAFAETLPASLATSPQADDFGRALAALLGSLGCPVPPREPDPVWRKGCGIGAI